MRNEEVFTHWVTSPFKSIIPGCTVYLFNEGLQFSKKKATLIFFLSDPHQRIHTKGDCKEAFFRRGPLVNLVIHLSIKVSALAQVGFLEFCWSVTAH